MAAPNHPIFGEIETGDLEAVKARVLADPAVLEQIEIVSHQTPPIFAIVCQQPAIALWLIEHRDGHSLDTRDGISMTALMRASQEGQLAIVKALAGAGASLSADEHGCTPLQCLQSGTQTCSTTC